MGLFNRKLKVSKKEFSDATSTLYAKGFNSSEVKKFKEVFRGDLIERGKDQPGVDPHELNSALDFMRRNRTLPEHKIQVIEEQMKKRM